MEDTCENIDKKYEIIDKKGSGASSIVFLVKDSTTNKLYAAKVMKKQKEEYDNEVEMLSDIKEINSPYILNLVDNGIGNVFRKGNVFKEKQYLILEYASKGDLFNYVIYLKEGLQKEYAKVIFTKILSGVNSCHSKKQICHRDLKPENILLDENFNPKIADFGYATYNTGKLDARKGTPGYAAPEIYKEKEYDGYKADIFSLGVILYSLYTGKQAFKTHTIIDSDYKYIKHGNYESYWKKVTPGLKGIKDLEDFENFKDLYNKMVSYNPDKRPTIEQISKSKWLKEIRDLKEDQLQKLYGEVIAEFLRREPTVNEVLKLVTEIKPIESLDCNRGIGDKDEDNSKKYFDLSLKPKYAKSGLGMNFIKIEGNFSPADIMNKLANKIKQKFKDNCKIDESKEELKFIITFDEEEISKELQEKLDELDIEEDGENEEFDINLLKKECIMKCKLYESLNGGHFLKFSKKSGYLEDYYNNLEIIISLVKEIL